MPLKTKVKVGNITNLSEARYCAGMGVDLLSFPIGVDSKSISIETFLEITEWISGPEFVLELGGIINEEILEKVTQMPSIQHIQIQPNQLETPLINESTKSIILSVSDQSIDSMDWSQLSRISYIIINSVKPDWKKIESLNQRVPILIDMSNDGHNLAEVLTKSISGIALNGSDELAAGSKSYDHLADILEVLDVD